MTRLQSPTCTALRRSGSLPGTGTRARRALHKSASSSWLVSLAGRAGLPSRLGLCLRKSRGEEPSARTRGSRVGEGQVHTSGPDQGWPNHNRLDLQSQGPNPRGTGSRPRASGSSVTLSWAKSGRGGNRPVAGRLEDGRRAEVPKCRAIKPRVNHRPDPAAIT